MENRFSIVIANYNSGAYLEHAISSVISQDYSGYELIVIDGGSSDNSLEVINKYDAHIDYWCSEKDDGQSDAFNKGFARATGDYFFWLNADDFLLPNSLALMNEFINNSSGFKWFCFNTLYVDVCGRVERAYCGLQWQNLLMNKLGPQVDAATSIFHRDLYEASQKFDTELHWAMDNDLWYQFMNMGYKYKRMSCFIYAFRIHAESKTMNNGFDFLRSDEQIRQTDYLLEKNEFYPDYRYMFLNKIYKFATTAIPRVFYNYKYRGTLLE